MKHFIEIEDLKKYMPKQVYTQLKLLLTQSSLVDNEESLIKIIEAWLTKQALFDKFIDHYSLKNVKILPHNSSSACIAITLSGSLVALGPLIKGNRSFRYTSINLRTDVPPTVEAKEVTFEGDIEVNKSINFSKGPVKTTSPIFDMCIIPENIDQAEQSRMIKKMNHELLDNFLHINKTIVHAENKNKNVLRNRNDLFHKWIIITWFLMGGLEKHIFLARAKLLWLELFTHVYESIQDKSNRDELFLVFTNNSFAQFIDDYKWYESEKKNFDIGLMKALEEIPEYDKYKEFAQRFIKQ